MPGYLLLTLLFFWLYTSKFLHLKFRDFGIILRVRWWSVVCSILLPLFVVAVFSILGETTVNRFPIGSLVIIIISSTLTALKAGITEELLFRGFIMRLLEDRWNKYIAILFPSFLFSLAHIPSMETFTVGGILLLIVSGTLVGIMFSLVAYVGKSVSNSILMHFLWNFVIVTDILHITTKQGAYGEPIISIIIPSNNLFLTGAGFGVEASLVAIIGYALVCLALIFIRHHPREI